MLAEARLATKRNTHWQTCLLGIKVFIKMHLTISYIFLGLEIGGFHYAECPIRHKVQMLLVFATLVFFSTLIQFLWVTQSVNFCLTIKAKEGWQGCLTIVLSPFSLRNFVILSLSSPDSVICVVCQADTQHKYKWLDLKMFKIWISIKLVLKIR